MFYRSTASEVSCDAPAYAIVRACRMIGFRRPEDVRWCRLLHFRQGQYRRLHLLSVRTWKLLLGMGETNDTHCSCGHDLPRLERYTFTCISGREIDYLLAQCHRCGTVFWE